MGPLRQFLMMAKPWQRVAAGVVVAVVGWLLGNYVLTAVGVVLVVLPVAAWVKRRRGEGMPASVAGEHGGVSTPDVQADVGEN